MQPVQPLHNLSLFHCDRVILAQDAAAADEGVLGEGAGLLVFTQLAQLDGEVDG